MGINAHQGRGDGFLGTLPQSTQLWRQSLENLTKPPEKSKLLVIYKEYVKEINTQNKKA